MLHNVNHLSETHKDNNDNWFKVMSSLFVKVSTEASIETQKHIRSDGRNLNISDPIH